MKRSPYKDATRTRAKYFPRDRVAVIYGKKRITWRELNQRIDRLGNALSHLGIKKGDLFIAIAPFLIPNNTLI